MQLGVAPRRLNGWEPREFTEYRYDGDRLVGTVTTREPEFDVSQVALLQAVRLFDSDKGPHGHPMSEATAAEANPDAPGGWHYKANTAPRIDYAERAIELAKDAFYKAYPEANRAGHIWYATRVDD